MVDRLSHFDHKGVARLYNLPNAVDPQEPATKAQLDAAIEGLSWKDSARVSTQGNISISSPGATIDGVTMVSGDRVLVRAQTTGSENGVYIWNGSATPLTRAADASTGDELENATISVDEGTSAGGTYRQTAVNFTIGTGSVAFASFGVAAPAASDTAAGLIEIATQSEVDAGTATNLAVTPATLAAWVGRAKRMSSTFGDGTAVQYDIVHNLGTRDVQVAVYRTSGNYDQVDVESRRIDVNTVRLIFVQAPTANLFRAVIEA